MDEGKWMCIIHSSERLVSNHSNSDGVLNPQGIRFGSSDLYSIAESEPFNNLISITLCVGRRRAWDSDEAVFLFVVMQPGQRFNDSLALDLKSAIRKGLSSKHVPRFILDVNEIPMTVNGKKIERLVKEVVSTGIVPQTISSTVANPGCLSDFVRFHRLDGKGDRSNSSKL